MRKRAAAMVLLALVVAGCSKASDDESRPATRRVSLTDGAVTRQLTVEIAQTSEQRRVGLMHRTSVPEGTGMLFVYPGPGSWGGIWMKDTLVPLDVAFIRDGEVFEVHTLQPCRADPCPSTQPSGEYDRVLEVPGGWFARTGLDVGARLQT